MYKEKISELLGKLQTSDEIILVRDMIANSGVYVQKVVALESYIITRAVDDPEEYRQRVVEMDKMRSTAHNALIASVAIVNRLCKTVDMSPIFIGDISKRVEVAEFAAELVNEIFQGRRL